MIDVLRNRTYATLFSAQVIALLGTGLLTIALGLLTIAGLVRGAVALCLPFVSEPWHI